MIIKAINVVISGYNYTQRHIPFGLGAAQIKPLGELGAKQPSTPPVYGSGSRRQGSRHPCSCSPWLRGWQGDRSCDSEEQAGNTDAGRGWCAVHGATTSEGIVGDKNITPDGDLITPFLIEAVLPIRRQLADLSGVRAKWRTIWRWVLRSGSR